MEVFLQVGIEILRLVPLILAFYVPAVLGVAIWKERGPGYRPKAMLMFVFGFGAIVAVQVLFRNVSSVQVLVTVGLSLVEIFFALVLARLTVYRLAD